MGMYTPELRFIGFHRVYRDRGSSCGSVFLTRAYKGWLCGFISSPYFLEGFIGALAVQSFHTE